MDDLQIVNLYWQRSEAAITETAQKYGSLCYRIAHNVLANKEDAEESVNDTYLAAWDQLPPNRPALLAPFLGKITRNLAISRWRSRTAAKRGGGEVTLALEELGECVAGSGTVEGQYIRRETVRSFRRFLETLPQTERMVFLRRYWYLDPVGKIAADFGFSQSKVKSMLHRTRSKLRDHLRKEDLL